MTFEQRLLHLVSEYELLYNPNHPCFSKTPRRNVAWDEIALKLNSDRDTCRKRWKNLRDTYKKLLMKIHDAGGVYKYRRRKWQYLSLISFVNKYEPLAPKEGDTSWPIFEDTCKETLAMAKVKLEMGEYGGDETLDGTATTEASYNGDVKNEVDQYAEHNSMPSCSNYYDNLELKTCSPVDEVEKDKIVVELTHSYAKSVQNETEVESEIEVCEHSLSDEPGPCRNYLAMLGAKIDASAIPPDVQINLEEQISELVYAVLAQYENPDQHVVYAEDIS